MTVTAYHPTPASGISIRTVGRRRAYVRGPFFAAPIAASVRGLTFKYWAASFAVSHSVCTVNSPSRMHPLIGDNMPPTPQMRN